jgi:hypothetical protein
MSSNDFRWRGKNAYVNGLMRTYKKNHHDFSVIDLNR